VNTRTESSAIAEPVGSFVALISELLSRSRAGNNRQSGAHCATTEAARLVKASIDVDGLQTNEELSALILQFSGDDAELTGTAPADLRARMTLRGSRRWLHDPSAIFEHLLAADSRDGSSLCFAYIDAAVELMHHIASLDEHVGPAELAAADRYRTLLTDAATQAGITPGSAEVRPDIDDLLAELDTLIGLDDVKERVRLIADLIAVRAMRTAHGLSNVATSHHLVFVGNPGTGKTTVARLFGQILHALGALRIGHLVEVDRAGLVAGYVGQTATRVDEVVERAMGGVLLIDEAHGLVRGDDGYGAEAVDALVKRMEDHREDLVVIATGYPREMQEFLDLNPGLRSRFSGTVEFADHSDDDLVAIFNSVCADGGYEPGHGFEAALRRRLAALERGPTFGNGRAARQLFEDAVTAHAGRVVQLSNLDTATLSTLVAADIAPS